MEEITKIINSLQNNEGILIDKNIVTYDFKITKFGSEHLQHLARQETYFNIISQTDRPGCDYFFHLLEETHFPPDSSLSKDFNFRMFKWHDLHWAIASIPINKKHLCYEIANQADMTIQNGIPILFEGHNSYYFPLDGDTTFTLGNKKSFLEGNEQDFRHEQRLKVQRLLDKKK